MARIRTIKPEFWDSPGTARASLRARLFYIAMWNWADDYGIGTANAKQLIGFAFPNDHEITVADYPTIRAEVSDCFDVLFYEALGRPYYCIPSWEEHQRTEKRAKRRNPLPSEGIPTVTDSPTLSSDVPAWEQGNRGTGEQGKLEQGKATPTASGAVAPRTGGPTQLIVAEWIAAQDQRPPTTVINQVAKQITQLVKDGIDQQTIRAGLTHWTSRGLHPSTLPSVVHEQMTRPTAKTRQQSATDDMFDGAMQRAQAKEIAQ